MDETLTLPDSNQQEDNQQEDLSERLLHAAAEVFAEMGYERAGVAEIARRAGVPTGAIYSRYTGKAELLLDAVAHHVPDQNGF